MFNSALWTGRGNSPKIEALDLVTRDRPDIPPDRSALKAAPRAPQSALEEYAQLSKVLGIEHPHIDADLKVEKFKAFLRMKDWPVFSLSTVCTYMDQKSAVESAAKSGWHWRPLRIKDDIEDARFGKPAQRFGNMPTDIAPASDYYYGPHLELTPQWQVRISVQRPEKSMVEASGRPYNKLVPIHALRKVAETERDFPDPVSFFVCDYAPAPLIEHPDPFLMAIVNNERLARGVGRFVIDFWDEPGFGIDQMLQPA